MKTLLVIALLLVAGCIPATQSEVQTLTTAVNQIVPLVIKAVAEDPVGAVKATVAATSSLNPYAVPILIGISILEGLGIFGINKLRKNNHTALEEVVIGVEDSKKNGGKLKEAFNATESLITRRKVAKIINGT